MLDKLHKEDSDAGILCNTSEHVIRYIEHSTPSSQTLSSHNYDYMIKGNKENIRYNVSDEKKQKIQENCCKITSNKNFPNKKRSEITDERLLNSNI